MHVAVVVNPRAGKFRRHRFDQRAVEALVDSVAARAGATAHVELTQAAGGGCDAARRGVASGADVVAAWGGDGTINEVVSVLAGSGTPLAIVRGGSGNGVARELGIPPDARRALEVAFNRHLETVDLARLDEHVFINIAGFGIDAVVAGAFNAQARGRALLGYVRLTIGEIVRYRPQHYVVRWDGGAFEGTALTVAVANSRQYGNGCFIAPQARIDDGQLDVVIVQPTTRVADLWRARRLFTGHILEDAHVRTARTTTVQVSSDSTLRGQFDGEVVRGLGTESRVTVYPGALRVCMPESWALSSGDLTV